LTQVESSIPLDCFKVAAIDFATRLCEHKRASYDLLPEFD